MGGSGGGVGEAMEAGNVWWGRNGTLHMTRLKAHSNHVSLKSV